MNISEFINGLLGTTIGQVATLLGVLSALVALYTSILDLIDRFNNKKEPEERKKYKIALFSCLGVFLLAAVLGGYTLLSAEDDVPTPVSGSDNDQQQFIIYEDIELSETEAGYTVTSFNKDSDIANLAIPDDYQGKPVVEIGENAFLDAVSLKSVEIPESVRKIGKKAFAGCTSLKSLTLPEAVTQIPDEMCRGCISLIEVNVNSAIEKIGSQAFSDCNEDFRLNRIYTDTVYVYSEYNSPDNNFVMKAQMYGGEKSHVKDMNENCKDDPAIGNTCIKCSQTVEGNEWGGWLFLNGYTSGGDRKIKLNDGKTDDQGMDLSGANKLTFYAKGEKGGEIIEFITCGYGYNGDTGIVEVMYPDSAEKQSCFVTLSNEWKQYEINLSSCDMSYIGCGFGYSLSKAHSGEGDFVFYLDEICFEGEF